MLPTKVEELFGAFLSQAPIAFAMFDSNWRYLLYSSQWLLIHGLAESDLIGKTHLEIFPNLSENCKEIAKRCLAGAVESVNEESFLGFDASSATRIWEFHPWRHKTGEIGGFIILAKTIPTPSKKAASEESQYRLLMEQAADGIFITDSQGKFVTVNSMACSMLGYTREELLQLTVPDVTAAIALARIPDDFAAVLKGETIRVETHILRKDGTIFPVELSSKMLPNGQLQGIVRDISERKRIEEALKASEARFQKLAANMPGVIYQFLLRPDGDKKIVYISSGCRDIFELEPEAVQQNADLLESLTHPNDLQSFHETVTASALTLTPWHYEGRIITPSGKIKWIQGASRPEKLESGEILWDGLLLDITERKMAEVAVYESEEKYRELLEGLNEAVFRISLPSGHYEYFSPAAYIAFGYTHSDFLSNPLLIQQIIHPDFRGYFQEKWSALCGGKVDATYEYKIIDPTGKERWIWQSNKGIFDDKGNIIALEGICRDVTESKLAEEKLRQYQEQLEYLVAKRTVELQKANEQLLKEIAERRQMEATLRESEARFRAAAEGSLDAFFILSSLRDETGRIVDFIFTDLNSNGEKMLSMSKEELIGKRLCELMPINRNGGFFEKYVQVVETQTVLEEEFPINTPEVKAKWLQHQVVPIGDGIAIASRDITERKSALEALWQSEAKFQNLAANMPGIIYQYALRPDGSHYFSYVSPHCRELYEREPEEILQNPDYPFDAVLPEERQNFIESIKVSAETLQPWSHENRIITPSGKIKWVRGQSRPERQANGNIIWDGLLVDITARKQAEEALRQSEAFYRAVVEDQTELICRFKPDGILTFVNDAYCRYFGKTRSELVGNSFTPLIVEEDRELVNQQFASLSLTKPVITYEERVIMPNGEIRWQQWTNRAIFDAQNNLVKLQAVGQDITDRKKAEEALARSYQRLMLLKQITAEIRASLDTQQILQTTVSQVGQAFGVSRSLIHIYVAFPVVHVPFVAEYVQPGYPPILGLEIPVDGNPHMQQLLAEDKAIASDNVYTDPLLVPAEPICRQIGLKSMLAIRTSYQGEPNGVIGLHQYDRFRHWTEEEVELLEAVANQVGIALFQARLLEQQTRQREQLTRQNLALQKSEARFREQAQREALLNRIANQIRNSLDIDIIIETTVHEVRNLLQVDRAGFMWYKPDANPPAWEAIKEAKSDSLPNGLGLFTTEMVGPLDELLRAGETLQIDGVATLKEPILKQFLLQRGYTSLLNVPFQTQFGKLGVLSLIHCSGSRPWTDSEVELMQAVVVQLAIAINQAEIYEQSRTAAATAQAQAQQLEAALSELQRTQTQLIQSEKMSSLGQLVAGVAHEINNPVSFIYGNIQPANTYIRDILHLLELYRKHYPEPDAKIQEAIESIDLDFVKEDLPKLMNSMKVGATRIKEIVKSLRSFSRLDEAELKPVNLHEGLDDTLLILEHRLKATAGHPPIQIIRDYGQLPLVECYAGLLNQVFMNLIANATDALEETLEKASENQNQADNFLPQIEISTKVINSNWVSIAITDNGSGIPAKVKTRLFNPFFTTKPVGKGTGLGLAISYQIITEKHFGRLQCFSEVGVGTTFVIEIPIQQQSLTS